MLGDEWDAKIERYIYGLPEEEEMAFWFYTCFEHPNSHSTWHKHIWCSQLIENRYFSFSVSDHTDMTDSAASFRPRQIYGRAMEAEWDEALVEYWRMREHVHGVRKTSAAMQKDMPERFPDPDPLLKYYDSRQYLSDEVKEKQRQQQQAPKTKLKILPPRKPKRRRRPSDPEDVPKRIPGIHRPIRDRSGKSVGSPLESIELAITRAACKEATPEAFDNDDLDELVPNDELWNEDEKDSEEDAEYSDDEEETVPPSRPSEKAQADPEQRRDSGGSDINVSGEGMSGREDRQSFYTQPGIDKLLDLPPLPPLPQMRQPAPRPSSSALPPAPPSPRPQ